MFLRLLPIFILMIFLSGCASTQMKAQNEETETRVTALEKDLQAKDAEIVDLQYQVKDLSSKVDSLQAPAGTASPDTGSAAASAQPAEESSAVQGAGNLQLIRVKVSPEKIQMALKAAGVYTGPIDGKIGSGTRAAIIEFQKSHGLKADGVLGRKTWDALKAYLRS